ncbi:MAG: EutN/CcmL family microcompartment protein [Desulfovibrionaceae bacterium]|nr:EutN/CcmL family microcompartment protein [Desulfovibrionaceae bacterium]
MLIGVVIGNVWATKKEDALMGLKLMVVQLEDMVNPDRRESFVAVDRVGAGIGERVLVVTGSSARQAVADSTTPVDAAIVGILDEPKAD